MNRGWLLLVAGAASALGCTTAALDYTRLEYPVTLGPVRQIGGAPGAACSVPEESAERLDFSGRHSAGSHGVALFRFGYSTPASENRILKQRAGDVCVARLEARSTMLLVPAVFIYYGYTDARVEVDGVLQAPPEVIPAPAPEQVP